MPPQGSEVAATINVGDLGLGEGMDLSDPWQNEMLMLTRQIRDSLQALSMGAKKNSMFGNTEEGGGLFVGGKLNTAMALPAILAAIGIGIAAYGDDIIQKMSGGLVEAFDEAAAQMVAATNSLQALLDSPDYRADREKRAATGEAAAAWEPLEGIVEAEKDLQAILKDNVVSQEETARFAEIINFLEKSRLESQTQINTLADEEGIYLSVAQDQHSNILDLLILAGRAKANQNAETRLTIALLQAENRELERQAAAMSRIAKLSGKRYSTSGETRTGPSGRVGQYDITDTATGATYSGYNENLNGQTVYVGVRPVG